VARALGEEIRDPHREAVDDDHLGAAAETAAGGDHVDGLLDGYPARGALRPVALDALAHVAIGPGGGEEAGRAARRAGQRDGVAALAAPRAAEDEVRLVLRGRHPGPPAKTGCGASARAGLLALGSPYSPRLPGSSASGHHRPWVSSPITVTGSRRI